MTVSCPTGGTYFLFRFRHKAHSAPGSQKEAPVHKWLSSPTRQSCSSPTLVLDKYWGWGRFIEFSYTGWLHRSRSESFLVSMHLHQFLHPRPCFTGPKFRTGVVSDRHSGVRPMKWRDTESKECTFWSLFLSSSLSTAFLPYFWTFVTDYVPFFCCLPPVVVTSPKELLTISCRESINQRSFVRLS